MKTHHAQSSGFTLIELMVTLAIAAILMMVAVPSFTDFQRNAQLTSVANNMLASINAAKGEAMKRGGDVVIAPFDGTSWASGMTVFVDKNNNRTYQSGTDVLIQQNTLEVPSYLTVTPNNAPAASPPYIRFNAQGYPRPVGSDLRDFTISIVRNDVTGSAVFRQSRYLKMAITGNLRICTPTSATDVNCNLTSNF
jgi:type IV fimbrial biogenesis protein FimT